jgi:hypothetical protein
MILTPTRVPRFLIKPALGTVAVDRGHPMARGLIGAWLFNETAGANAYDLLGERAPFVFNTATWSSGVKGPVVSYAGSGGGGAVAAQGLDAALELCIALRIYDQTPNSGVHTLNRDSAPRCWIIRPETSTSVNWHTWDSGGNLKQLVPAGTSWAAGEWFDFICQASAPRDEMQVFFNGTSAGTGAFTGGAGLQTSTSQQMNFFESGGGTTIQFSYLYLYSGVYFSESLASWLHNEPYAFLRPKIVRYYSFPQTGGLSWKLAGYPPRLAGVGGLAG